MLKLKDEIQDDDINVLSLEKDNSYGGYTVFMQPNGKSSKWSICNISSSGLRLFGGLVSIKEFPLDSSKIKLGSPL